MITRSISRVTAALAVCAAAVVAAPADAQQIDSPYEFVESRMGFWAFGSAVFTDRGPIDIGPASGYAAGLGYTVRISGPFNFDARVAYLPTEREVFAVGAADPEEVEVDPRVGLEPLGTADLSLVLVDGSLRFDITGPRTWYRLQPYALIGAGAVLRLTTDDSFQDELEDDERIRFRNGFTGHVGAGVEWYASQRFTVRLDARDILWKLHVPEGFFTDGRIVDSDQWVQTAHLSLGLSYRF